MKLRPTFVLLTLLAVLSLPLAGSSISFQYSFPLNGVPDGVTGSGVLTTTSLSADQLLIVGITGTRTVAGETDEIASLTLPGGFGGNDNVLYLNAPYLDSNGLSFHLKMGKGDNGSGDVNVFFDPQIGDGYTENSSVVGFGVFTISTGETPVSEPRFPTLAIVALFGTFTSYRWMRRRVVR